MRGEVRRDADWAFLGGIFRTVLRERVDEQLVLSSLGPYSGSVAHIDFLPLDEDERTTIRTVYDPTFPHLTFGLS